MSFPDIISDAYDCLEEDNINSNIIKEEDYKKRAKAILNKISSILEKSLGYYGSTTVVQDPIYGHFITKDGYSILKKIKFGDELSSTLLKMINEISRDLVREVGDGSTSSVVTANHLFENISESMKDPESELSKVPPQTIINSLMKIQDIIIEKIKEMAIPITDENFDVIKNIATVSNNNDEYCGNIIYDVYKEIKSDGFVFLENSHNEKDYFEILNGMEISKGIIDRCFATELDKITCSFQDSYVLMINDTLDDTDLTFIIESVVGPVVGSRMKPLVIIAKSYTLEFVNCWKINKAKNKDMKLALVDFNLNNYNDFDIYDDLAIYLGATILDKRNIEIYQTQTAQIIENNAKLYEYLGECKKFISNDKSSQFVEGKSKSDAVEQRIKYLDTKIEELKLEESKRSIDSDMYKLEKRKANLQSKIARLFVGGTTDIEKETRKYLMEDAVFACKSALKYGYIPGCNLTIPKIINELYDTKDFEDKFSMLDEELLSLIAKSFYNCFASMLRNANIPDSNIDEIYEICISDKMVYNLKHCTEETVEEPFELDSETSIINSCMTDIMIMKSSFSIIGLLVTSNQFISNTLN